MSRRSVDFPLPESPMTTKISPRCTSKSASKTPGRSGLALHLGLALPRTAHLQRLLTAPTEHLREALRPDDRFPAICVGFRDPSSASLQPMIASLIAHTSPTSQNIQILATYPLVRLQTI